MTHNTKVTLWALTLCTVISAVIIFISGFVYTATQSLKASLTVIAIAFVVYLFGCYRSIAISEKKRYCFIWSFILTLIINTALFFVVISDKIENFTDEERMAGYIIISFAIVLAMITANIGAVFMARKLAPLKIKAKMMKENYEVSRPHCFRCGKPLRLLELKCKNCGYKRISFKNNDEQE